MPLDPSEFFNELEVDEFREIFDLFDSDGGGSIDASELGSVMRTLGKHPSEEELVKLVKQIDEDGSGEIE
jgi:calmodulin